MGEGTTPTSAAVGRRAELWAQILRDPRVWFAVPVLLVIVLAAVFADFISPYDPTQQRLLENLQPPSIAQTVSGGFPHLAGTDQLGRDVLSRTIHGARLSLAIGLVTTGLAAVVGVIVGLIAGYSSGWLGTILVGIADVQIAFPFLILAITVIAGVGPSALAVTFTLAIWGWVPFARLVRGEVLTQRAKEYVAAEQMIGSTRGRILLRHILPNISSSVLVQLTFFVGIVIVSEGALSFLGLGVQPPDASWGRMMSEGRARLATAWWMSVAPGLALSATVLAVNVLGDALADALNPKTVVRVNL